MNGNNSGDDSFLLRSPPHFASLSFTASLDIADLSFSMPKISLSLLFSPLFPFSFNVASSTIYLTRAVHAFRLNYFIYLLEKRMEDNESIKFAIRGAPLGIITPKVKSFSSLYARKQGGGENRGEFPPRSGGNRELKRRVKRSSFLFLGRSLEPYEGFVKDFSLSLPFHPPFSQETKVWHAASKVSKTAKVEKQEETEREREKGRIFLSFRRKKKKKERKKKSQIKERRHGGKGGGEEKKKEKRVPRRRDPTGT